MSLEAYWREYGECPQCHADAGQPCVDLRFFSRFNDVAHRHRKKRTYLDKVTAPLVLTPEDEDMIRQLLRGPDNATS